MRFYIFKINKMHYLECALGVEWGDGRAVLSLHQIW